MTSVKQPVGYVAVDGSSHVVWGIGATPDAAIEGAVRDLGPHPYEEQAFRDSLRAIPASAALITEVSERGGDLDFYIMSDAWGRPIAMLPAECEDAD